MRIREIIKLTKKWSIGKRLKLAAKLIGCDLSNRDNYGQIILYTDVKWKGNELVQMVESDFEDDEDRKAALNHEAIVEREVTEHIANLDDKTVTEHDSETECDVPCSKLWSAKPN